MSKIRNFKLKNKNKKKSRAEWGAGVLVFCRPCKDARSKHPSILLPTATVSSFSTGNRCLRQDSLSPLRLDSTIPDPQRLRSLFSPKILFVFCF